MARAGTGTSEGRRGAAVTLVGRRRGPPGSLAGRLDSRELDPRHRRTAQRRQIDDVQRPDPQRRAGRELPVRHHRAQRGRGAAAGPAARHARRDVLLGEGGPGDGVVRRHRRHRRGRQRGRRAGQQVPRQHPRGRRDLPGRARLRRRRRRPRRRPRRPGRGHRDDRDRARPRRPPDDRQGPPAPREGGAGQEGDQGRRRRGPARADRAERGPHPLLRRPRLAAAARAEPA